MLRWIFVSLTALLLLFVSGCGGSGGGGSVSQSGVLAQVPIGWAQRAREFGGPESALSAVVTFTAAGTSGQDVSFEVDRLTAPAAYTQSYPTSAKVKTGVRQVQVWFYAAAGGTGAIVGEASASVLVGPKGTLAMANGSALGTIEATGTVQSVQIISPQNVTSGQATNIMVSVFGAQNSLIAVSPGSVSYQVTNGTGAATINSQGQIVGTTVGAVSLVASIDGISSFTFSIVVQAPAVTTTTITQANNGLLLDPQTGHLWASVPSTASPNANSVIEIDPTSGAVLSSIFVGSEPTALAISDDGTALYVGLNGADQIARVDPVAKTLVSSFNLMTTGGSSGNPGYADCISVQPGNPSVIATTIQDPDDSGFDAGCIYSNGSLLPNSMGIYDGSVLAFSSSTTLWGSDPGFSPPTLYQGAIGPTGSALTSSNRQIGGTFKIFGGNLYFTNGQVTSGVSGALLGTFAASAQYVDVTADPIAERAFFVLTQFGSNSSELEVFDTGTFEPVASAPLPASLNTQTGYSGLTRWGSKGLAFRDSGHIYLVAQAPGL